jgi:uncharacterized protein YdaU (DUF1376 family)
LSKLLWYPRYPLSYQFATQKLSLVQHGIYSLLLDRYYLNNGPLTGSIRDLLRAIGAPITKRNEREMEVVLQSFFIQTTRGWEQERCEMEIKQRAELIEKRRKAAEVRHSKHAHADAHAPAHASKAPDAHALLLHNITEDTLKSTTPSSVANPNLNRPVQPQGTSSEKSDAGATAPTGPLDVKKLVWKTGVDYLTRNGVPEPQARTVIGKWRKHYRDADILNAMAASDSEVAANPIAFIQRVLNRSETNDKRAEQFKPSDVFRRSYANGDDAD